MLLGLAPGYRGPDERLDRGVLATALATLVGGISFLIAMMLLFFPEWIHPRVFASWLPTTSIVRMEMATAGYAPEAWTGHDLIPQDRVEVPSKRLADPPSAQTNHPVTQPTVAPSSAPANPPTARPGLSPVADHPGVVVPTASSRGANSNRVGPNVH